MTVVEILQRQQNLLYEEALTAATTNVAEETTISDLIEYPYEIVEAEIEAAEIGGPT